LQQFAFDHLLSQFDERVENAKIALLHGDFESLHVEPVAGQHTFRISPLSVRGGTPAPGLRLVDDVVVYQGGSVNDFNDRAQPDGAASLIIEEPRRKQQQSRAYAFAPAGAEILPNFRNGFDVRDCVAPELALDRGQVVAQQLENFFTVDDGWGTQGYGLSSLVRPVICELHINS